MRLACFALLLCACGPAELSFPSPGPLTGIAGRSGFRFGAATAATQIEDQNPSTDWYLFTKPITDGGLGKHHFVDQASGGYTRALDDIALVEALHLDAYRFSIEWARVMPTRGTIDEAALAHYRALLEALHAKGIRPMVTVHHFANPVWIDDPRDPKCTNGPSDTNLCGLGHPVGGPLVIAEFGRFARLLGERFGDLVDEWGTLNEPVNYLLSAYGVGLFPPGKMTIFEPLTGFVPVVRDFLAAHVAIYRALKAADTVDVDGDGVAAAVGLPLSVIEWQASRQNAPSEHPNDLKAKERVTWLYHHLAPEALLTGRFDANLDGDNTGLADEMHPDWAGTLDWLGVQYYFRAGVTGEQSLLPGLGISPCFSVYDFGACVKPFDPTYCVPQMGYEYDPQGLYPILRDFGTRWGHIPLLVTESGIGTDVGARRSAAVVRTLEQIAQARAEGIDVRGYYHWSLYDNFEWDSGFAPHFGLYGVDRATFARTPSSAVDVLSAIAGRHAVSGDQRAEHGGEGPLPPEAGIPADPVSCTKPALGL